MATADSAARAAEAKKAAARKKRIAEARMKSTAPKMGADRLSSVKRTGTTAGKPSGNIAERAKQNAGVADGTIRLGAKGKSYNIFDAKTQTWKRGVVAPASKPKPKISSKTVEPRTDRLSKPFPHKEGYKTLGAEGNKWVSKKK